MKKLFTVAVISALAFAPAAFAVDKQDIKEDKGAIAKDDAAIAKQDANIAVNRAEKADAKANGDVAAQAGNSVQLGANHTAKAEKKLEKKVDEKILEHDTKKVKEEGEK